MRKGRILATTTLAVMMLTLSFAAASTAQEESPSASADVGVFSKYIWRGFELSDDSLVIQPAAGVSYKGFGFSLWGNLDTSFDDGTGDESQFNETDLTLSYDTSFDMVSLGVGYIYYALDGIDDSKELYVTIGLDTLLAPTLSIYREISSYQGWYLNFGISHSFQLTEDITLDLAGSVGYYDYDDEDDGMEVDDDLMPTGDAYSSLHDGLISVGLTIPVYEYITVSPMIAYSFALSDDADNFLSAASFDGDDSDFFFGGVTVSFSF